MKPDRTIRSTNDNELQPWSLRTADIVLRRHPLLSRRWHYEPGVVLSGIQQVWRQSGNIRYFDYIKQNIDTFVDQSGRIRTYRLEEYNLDQINEGKLLFALFEQTGENRYKQATYLLREQLRTHPRAEQGGFWHKLRYPHQMWLDGVYMAAPFYAQFAATFEEPAIFDDIALQINLLNCYAHDSQTGLFYHAWDASRSQKWANPVTGCSPNFWARAIGWFMMAIPDILEHFPLGHPQRESIIRVFRKTAEAIVRVQDQDSGVWRQVIDQGNRPGNYLEASASCMLVYALAKGVRLGYLGPEYEQVALRGYGGILEQFVEVDEQGWVNLHQICGVGGLGGEPYRDGSFDYYISEKIVSNDYKGIGPFIMASVEMEHQ